MKVSCCSGGVHLVVRELNLPEMMKLIIFGLCIDVYSDNVCTGGLCCMLYALDTGLELAISFCGSVIDEELYAAIKRLC